MALIQVNVDNSLPPLHGKERGGIIELPTKPGDDFLFIPFLFNPDQYEETDGNAYTKTSIPLFADQVNQYVSGSGRTLKYTLFLEYERIQEIYKQSLRSDAVVNEIGGRLSNKELVTTKTFSFQSSSSINAKIDFPKNIEGYLDALEKLRLPRRGEKPGQVYVSAPPRIMIIFGFFYRIGYLEKVGIQHKELFATGQLRSTQVEVDMIIDGKGRSRTVSNSKNQGFSTTPPTNNGSSTSLTSSNLTIAAPAKP